MGIKEFPEIKFAQRIIKKHSLKIPFNIEQLVKLYAKVIYKNIPIQGIDGVSLNLKAPGKQVIVVVNSNINKKRQIFTLAHEFGHIIIPWHLGTIVDDTLSQSYKDYEYSILEQEANRFASELLMPRDWVLDQYSNLNGNLSNLHNVIVLSTGVSSQAAAIRMTNSLEKDIIYCAEQYETILFSGSSANTNASLPVKGTDFNKYFYPYFDNYFIHTDGQINYHWWKISSSIRLSHEIDDRTWREILDDIVTDIKPGIDCKKFKNSINGIIAFANGKTLKEGDYTVDSVVAAVIYRLRRPGFEDFVAHKDFYKFVSKKVESMLAEKILKC